ncbi:MAG: glycosyltransferase [Bacteroidia bacterium]|nr:MAG: glycosyltransferase [Bacteroidia bacterium]
MKKILIIQQKMIGDVLTSTFLFEAIKKKYPHLQVDYLINAHTYPVVKNNPYIDNIVQLSPEDEKNIFRLLHFAKKNIHGKYDTIIDVYSKIQSNLFTLLSGAKTKVAHYKWYTTRIYNHRVAFISHDKDGTIKDRLRLLEAIFPEPFSANPPRIYLSAEEEQKGREFLTHNGIHPSKKLYMIGVLGSSPGKTYPLPYMAQLIDYVARHTEGEFLFNYIPRQRKEVQQIFQTCSPKTRERIHIDTYAPGLRDFLCVLKHCNAFIGNEGGAVHMAKALNIPTFSIFAPHISKAAWELFPNEKDRAVHPADYKPELFTKKIKKEELYQRFTFDLFEEDLLHFLQSTK